MSGIEKVVKKLKNHVVHKTKSAAELRQLAVELISPEKIREKFIHLLEPGQALAREIVEEDNEDLLHSLEFEAQHEKIKHDTAKACHIPVKLSLQKLSITPPGAHSFAKMLKFEYGALHSAIMVGDVVIEWGREELVQPRRVKHFHTPFKGDVTKHGEWAEMEGAIQVEMSLANRQRDTEKKLKTLCKSLDEILRMIDKLSDVIADYNSNKEYSVLKCNCQNFARDALAALGIKKPVEFTGELQKRFEQFKEGNIKVPPGVKSHESLDAHVGRYRDELSTQEMEYLQCLYFEVHSPAIEKSSDPDNWECGIPTCKSAELDTLIREHSFHNSSASKRNVDGHRNSTGSRTAASVGGRGSFSQVSQATAPPPNGAPPLCSQCHKFYTNVEHPEMCRGCLLEKTKRETSIHSTATHSGGNETGPQSKDQQKCRDCNHFYAGEAYGLCHGCFLESTKRQETSAPIILPLQSSHNGHEKPQQHVLSDRLKCRDCNHFYADEVYNGLCHGCFLESTKRPETVTPTVLPFQSKIGHEKPHQPVLSDRQKCQECRYSYANEVYNGLCHTCFLASTKRQTHTTVPPYSRDQRFPQQQIGDSSGRPKCEECKNFYADEAYNGLCHGCFMFKTERESILIEEVPKVHEQYMHRSLTSPSTQSPRSVRVRSQSYTPGYKKCQTYHCKNSRTENGYCDICNFRRTGQNECYLCTGRSVTHRNYVCNAHKLWLINNA